MKEGPLLTNVKRYGSNGPPSGPKLPPPAGPPMKGTQVKVTMTGPNRGNVWFGNELMIDVEIADGVPLEFILPHHTYGSKPDEANG